MKIIVTGSEGYIGSKLVKALKEAGHDVIRIDTILGTRIEDTEFEKVDVIFHMAAQADVQKSRINPSWDAVNNIGSTISLIRKNPNTRIIYAASAASLEPNSPYGLSKKVCEDYIKMMCNDYVILRIPNPWGEGGRGAVDYFMKADVIKINGDGLQSRTIIHVNDIVKAFVKSLDWTTGEYCLGGGEKFDLTVKEIAERVARQTGKKVIFDLTYDPVRQGEVFAATLPNTTPDWTPTIELV